MYEGLKSGCIKCAALDVFEVEPCRRTMWDFPNVLISPHSANTVAAENDRIEGMFIENLGRFIRGVPLLNPHESEGEY
jgi:glyoxylate/hydroxypyruvate reductase